jgi:hypothetical protein
MTSPTRLLEVVLALVIAAAGVGLLLDDQLSLGLALAGVALLIAWWRLKLPPP